MSVNRFMNNMTDQMLDCCLDPEYLKTEVLYCFDQYVKCLEASKQSLPATTNEGNSVVFGAIKEMMYLANYWKRRLDLARCFLQNSKEHAKWVDDQGLYDIVFHATVW